MQQWTQNTITSDNKQQVHQWRTHACCCMVLPIAGPPDQSSPNSGNKCQLARPPNVAKFCHMLTRSVQDICCQKFLHPRKVDQISPKSRTKPSAKFHRVWPNDVREKPYEIFYFVATGTSWAKVHQSRHWCTARPGLPTRHSSFPSDNQSTGHLLPNFTDFIKSMLNKNPANDMYLHIMRRQWKSCKNVKSLTWTDRFSRNVFPFAWFLPIAVAFHAKYAPWHEHNAHTINKTRQHRITNDF